eukprot:scaffold76831_cov29-Attheya_sp.AAC.2
MFERVKKDTEEEEQMKSSIEQHQQETMSLPIQARPNKRQRLLSVSEITTSHSNELCRSRLLLRKARQPTLKQIFLFTSGQGSCSGWQGSLRVPQQTTAPTLLESLEQDFSWMDQPHRDYEQNSCIGSLI